MVAIAGVIWKNFGSSQMGESLLASSTLELSDSKVQRQRVLPLHLLYFDFIYRK
jgi:hypothetical protein